MIDSTTKLSTINMHIQYPGPKLTAYTSIGLANLYMHYGALEIMALLTICMVLCFIVGLSVLWYFPTITVIGLYALFRRMNAIDNFKKASEYHE